MVIKNFQSSSWKKRSCLQKCNGKQSYPWHLTELTATDELTIFTLIWICIWHWNYQYYDYFYDFGYKNK